VGVTATEENQAFPDSRRLKVVRRWKKWRADGDWGDTLSLYGVGLYDYEQKKTGLKKSIP
jgi:hypothetical protein